MDVEKTKAEINQIWLLQRCSFREHPLQREREKHRCIYAFLLYQWLKSITINQKLIAYCMNKIERSLQIPHDEIFRAESDFNKGLKEIANIFWHGGFSFGKRNYQCLYVLECVCLDGLINGEKKSELKQDLIGFYRVCSFHVAEKKLLEHFVDSLFVVEKRWNVSSIQNANLRNCFAYMDENYYPLYRYCQLPRYHIAVCATMSSGKSTLINALLGGDYIPRGNEACTAKITSIFNYADFSSMIGCYEKEQKIYAYHQNIDHRTLERWNQDNSIQHVFLQSNLQSLGSDNVVLVVHDTPGTNSSQNPTHYKKTMDFLGRQPLQAIIYVLNAEQLSTTDNQFLLKDIKKRVIDKGKTKIIFLINKVDSFDEENGDDIKQSVEDVSQELTELGFSNSVIIPVMAYGAMLFKMALTGKADMFTRKEALDFAGLYSLCMDEDVDVTKYQRNVKTGTSARRMNVLRGKIVIRKKEYEKERVAEALRRTGIGTIEALLSKMSE